jgi:GNAT superfamily N-acetyltransferase
VEASCISSNLINRKVTRVQDTYIWLGLVNEVRIYFYQNREQLYNLCCMKPKIVITQGFPEDAETLSKIKQIIWLDTYLNKDLGITPDDIYAKDFLCKERIAKRAEHMRLDDGVNNTLVACVDRQIVGYGRATRGVKFDEIVTLYVLPEWQGQKIGTELLKQLLAWVGNNRVVKLGVVPYNKKAISFYEKFGFKLGDLVYHNKPVFPSGKDLPEVEMIRNINID